MEGELRKCLIGMHDFTGCDTASSLTGRVKITALRLVKHHTSCQENVQAAGYGMGVIRYAFSEPPSVYIEALLL